MNETFLKVRNHLISEWASSEEKNYEKFREIVFSNGVGSEEGIWLNSKDVFEALFAINFVQSNPVIPQIHFNNLYSELKTRLTSYKNTNIESMIVSLGNMEKLKEYFTLFPRREVIRDLNEYIYEGSNLAVPPEDKKQYSIWDTNKPTGIINLLDVAFFEEKEDIFFGLLELNKTNKNHFYHFDIVSPFSKQSFFSDIQINMIKRARKEYGWKPDNMKLEKYMNSFANAENLNKDSIAYTQQIKFGTFLADFMGDHLVQFVVYTANDTKMIKDICQFDGFSEKIIKRIEELEEQEAKNTSGYGFYQTRINKIEFIKNFINTLEERTEINDFLKSNSNVFEKQKSRFKVL